MKVRQFLMPAFVVAGLSCAALSAHAQSPRSRMQCSPVTPDTKVPFIDVSQLPDISRDPLYFEGCSDRDYAWTLQSYPDPKYAPKRTYEHQARVNFLLQGLKDYVTTESDDWASYINAWLGSNLPPSDVERRRFSDGDTTRSMSYRTGNTLTKFGVTSEILSTYSTQHVSPQGVMIFSQRELVIRGLDTTKLCITSVDLQKAFENQPGYLFRPITVRTSQPRPNPEELAKLGGQWFGYDVYAFIEPVAKQAPGLMSFGFGFKPCAMNISFNLTKNIFQGDKQ
jgi:hypothetical protein